jgi:starch-binding outer membrane protein, SusD/RagB family
MKYILLFLFALTILNISSCKLDNPNPNNPTDDEVLTTREGLLAASIGMKQLYATDVLGSLYLVTGCTGREVKGISTLTNIQELESGGALLPSNNSAIFSLWARSYRVMAIADDIIAKAPSIFADDSSTRSGIIAHAQLFKSMSIYALLSGFEKFPLDANKNSAEAVFSTRTQAINKGIDLLNSALLSLNRTPSSVDFNTRVLGTNFNLVNIIQIYRARFYLLIGNYNQSFLAANAVPLASENFFTYDGSFSINPLFAQFTTAGNFAPRADFGLPAGVVEPTDRRIGFYLQEPNIDNSFNQTEVLRSAKGFATSSNAIIPVYLPDEIRLIKAESIVRGAFQPLATALNEINSLRRQINGDIFGLNCGLANFAGPFDVSSVLNEIYVQRCIELYLTGQRLLDNRRFDRIGPTIGSIGAVPLNIERSRNYYPYPDQERQNNPNTPVDPGI